MAFPCSSANAQANNTQHSTHSSRVRSGQPGDDDPNNGDNDNDDHKDDHKSNDEFNRRRRNNGRNNNNDNNNDDNNHNNNSNNSNSITSMLQREVIKEQAKIQVRSTFDTVKQNFHATFHGFPTNSNGNETKIIQQTCDKAVAFIVDLIQWIVLYVEPNKSAYPETLALQAVVTKLRANAHRKFQLHQSRAKLNDRVSTLKHFIVYIIENYVKVQNLHKLKVAVLAEMPTDFDLHLDVVSAFDSHSLITGIFLQIIDIVKEKGLFLNESDYTDLLITNKQIFYYRYQYFLDKKYISKFNSMLSDQKDHIRNPMNLENLMEAARLWQIQENKRKQIHAGIAAQQVKLRSKSSFHDPTSTIAGKNLAHAHYLDRKYQNHTYYECDHKHDCFWHKNEYWYKEKLKRRRNNNNGNQQQSRPYRPTPFKSRYPKSPNYPKSSNHSKLKFQPRFYNSKFNSNNNNYNRSKSWNQNSIRERYNSRRKGRGGKSRRGKRNFNQRYQNVPSYPSRQRYNTTADPNQNQQQRPKQHQPKHQSNRQSDRNNNTNNQHQKHLKNMTKRQHSHQQHKKKYHGDRANHNSRSNDSNWRNNNNKRNNTRPTFKPTTNTVVATMTNSDFDSDVSSVDSFEFIAPTTNSAISSSIYN